MAGINALIRRIERLGAAEIKQGIASKTRDAALAECVRGFREERDPYGVRWAPRKAVRGWAALAFGVVDDGHKLLDATGRMIGSLTARAGGAGRVLMRILGIAKWHQGGTKRMVARRMFPDQGRGLGTWSEPIHRAAVDSVRERMK